MGQLIAANANGGASGTLDPTLVVIKGTSEVSGLNNIGSSAVAISTNPESVAPNGTDTYKIGGRMSISSENQSGSYSGQYTIAAIVR